MIIQNFSLEDLFPKPEPAPKPARKRGRPKAEGMKESLREFKREFEEGEVKWKQPGPVVRARLEAEIDEHVERTGYPHAHGWVLSTSDHNGMNLARCKCGETKWFSKNIPDDKKLQKLELAGIAEEEAMREKTEEELLLQALLETDADNWDWDA